MLAEIGSDTQSMSAYLFLIFCVYPHFSPLKGICDQITAIIRVQTHLVLYLSAETEVSIILDGHHREFWYSPLNGFPVQCVSVGAVWALDSGKVGEGLDLNIGGLVARAGDHYIDMADGCH